MLNYQVQEECFGRENPYINTLPNPVVGRARKLGTNIPICGLYVEINNMEYWRSRDGTLRDLLNHPPAH